MASAKGQHSVFFLPGARGRGWLRPHSRAAPAPAALTRGTPRPRRRPWRRGEPLLRAGHPRTSSHLPAGPPAPVRHPPEPRGRHVRVCLSPAAAGRRAGGPGVTVPLATLQARVLSPQPSEPERGPVGLPAAHRGPGLKQWGGGSFLLWQHLGRKLPPSAVLRCARGGAAVSRSCGRASGLRASAATASGVSPADVYTVPAYDCSYLPVLSNFLISMHKFSFLQILNRLIVPTTRRNQ